jgi:hypothetical protein
VTVIDTQYGSRTLAPMGVGGSFLYVKCHKSNNAVPVPAFIWASTHAPRTFPDITLRVVLNGNVYDVFIDSTGGSVEHTDFGLELT